MWDIGIFQFPKGFPIGNLTSQFFANVYLNELDQFVKHRLGCRCYIRYCDDFLLLSTDPSELAHWHERIQQFLWTELRLELNSTQYRLRPISSGIDFLGYIVRRRYVLVRKRVVNHFQEKLDDFGKELSIKKAGRIVSWRYPVEQVDHLRAVTDSYLGHFGWANSRRLVRRLFIRHSVLRACFILKPTMPPRIAPRYKLPRSVKARIHHEYRWWIPPRPRAVELSGGKNRLPRAHPLWVDWQAKENVLVFFPVGSFYEFYNSQAMIAQSVLGLKRIDGMRGFQVGCGFPRRRLGVYLSKAKKQGLHVALLGAAQPNNSQGHGRRLVRLFRGRGECVGQVGPPFGPT